VVFAEGLESIGDWCFQKCAALEEVQLPSTLKTIGDWAFDDCFALKKADLPEGLQSLGKYCFSGAAIVAVKIPKSLSVITKGSFYKCKRLAELHIPGNITKVEAEAFYGCSGLKTLTLEEGIQDIENNAFYECENVEGKLVVPRSMISVDIPYGSKIKELVIGSALENLSGFAKMFSNILPELEKVTLLEGVRSIPQDTFLDCNRLSCVELPNTLESIGEDAFQSCTALEKITIPGSVTAIHDCAFQYTDNLTEIRIGEGCEKIGADAFANTSEKRRVVYLPSTIQSLGNQAFRTWAATKVRSPKNTAIQQYCSADSTCYWEYIASEAEIRAEEERKLREQKAQQCAAAKQAAETANSLLQRAVSQKEMAEKNLVALRNQLAQQEQLLPTLTGLFAGGKRKKCQEQIDAIKCSIAGIERTIADSHQEIAKQSRALESARQKMQELSASL